MRGLTTVLLFTLVPAASVLVTLGLFAVLGGPARSSADRKQPVAFSDFLAEVEAGRVAEIRVSGRTYTFVVADEALAHRPTRVAIGPPATLEEVQAVRPSDPARPLPRVIVEGAR